MWNVEDGEDHGKQKNKSVPFSFLFLFGGLLGEGNIQVINPYQEGIHGRQYNGMHYFFRKTSGKNTFGVSVPVWVYGGIPPDMKQEAQNYKNLLCEIERFESKTK